MKEEGLAMTGRQGVPGQPAVGNALHGVRVIDMATVIAGPGAARYLADFGADVIKVEPPDGDGTRRLGWTLPGDLDSLFWKLVNRGKRSVTLDLKDSTARERMLALLDTAQILVENLRPGKLEQLGLAPDYLLSRNPALVILRVSGFGQTGPYAARPGFATIAEALSGLSDLSGEPGGGPLLPPIALTDEVTALVGAFAAMVALRHAERLGVGQVIDVSLLESTLQILGPLPSAWAHLGYLQPRLGSGLPYAVPRGTYRCSDGVWVALSASADSVASRVLQLLGLDGDSRFVDFPGRFAHREALERLTRNWIAQRSSGHVLAAFAEVDAAIAPVYTMADVAQDPHIKARNCLIPVDGVIMQNVVAGMSKTPGSVRSVGPSLGQHNEEVFAELAERES
jgi:crotonobetainyl-CoA:carnitine CoA-transferase CaiB-like acyl-CoA transferase